MQEERSHLQVNNYYTAKPSTPSPGAVLFEFIVFLAIAFFIALFFFPSWLWT